MQLVDVIHLKTEVKLLPNVAITFHNAGPYLGAAIVEMNLTGNTQQKKSFSPEILDAITTPS